MRQDIKTINETCVQPTEAGSAYVAAARQKKTLKRTAVLELDNATVRAVLARLDKIGITLPQFHTCPVDQPDLWVAPAVKILREQVSE